LSIAISPFAGLLCLFSPETVSASNDEKPYNILWLGCEDIGPALCAYGVEGVETPNIDRLAAEGITYTNAYATVGVCAPSRSSIITAMYPARIGSHNMRTARHWTYRPPEKETYDTYQEVLDKNRPQCSPIFCDTPLLCQVIYRVFAGKWILLHQQCQVRLSIQRSNYSLG